jgi:hypothetical protein
VSWDGSGTSTVAAVVSGAKAPVGGSSNSPVWSLSFRVAEPSRAERARKACTAAPASGKRASTSHHTTREPGVEAVREALRDAELGCALRSRDERINADLSEQPGERATVGLDPVGLPREEEEGHQPQRPDVRRGTHATFPIRLLGRHEEGRAEGLRPGLLDAVRDELGDPEVEDLRRERHVAPLGGREEDVLRLEITMHDPLGVGLLERVPDLGEDLLEIIERDGPGPRRRVRQLLAAKQLHHQVGSSAGLVHAGRDRLHDVVALDVGGDLRLADEALAHLGVPHPLGGHELEGAALARGELLGDVHRAHSPFTEWANHTKVTSEDRAGSEAGQGCHGVLEAYGRTPGALHRNARWRASRVSIGCCLRPPSYVLLPHEPAGLAPLGGGPMPPA